LVFVLQLLSNGWYFQNKMKTLSIIIPCYNEAATIAAVIKAVKKADSLGLKKEIIVVDDKSRDGSNKILKKLARRKEIVLIAHKRNEGKGKSVKDGILKSSGEIVLIQDADLEYDPADYPLLIKPIIDNRADVVYGSRFVGGSPHRVVYFWHFVMNRILTTFSNMLTNINLTDMETCYKAFRGDLARKVAAKLKSKRFGFEPEITAKIAKIKNARIYEVGVSYFGRTYKEGKHIKWIDGAKAVWEVIRFNLFE